MNLTQLADEAAQKYPITEDAVAAIVGAMTDEILKEVQRTAALAAINEARHRLRAAAKRGAEVRSLVAPGGFELAARTVSIGFMDGWIVGQKRMGDCTRADLSVAAQRAQEQALGSIRNQRLFTELAKRLPDDDAIVRDAVGENETQVIWRTIAGDVGKPAAMAG